METTMPSTQSPRRIINREFTCAALMIASIFLSLVSFVNVNPAERTLSNIGAEDPMWFFAWGIVSAIAVYFNVKLLGDKLGLKNKWFDLMAKIGSFAVVVTVCIWGDAWWQVAIHWTSGMTFGILSFAAVFILLCVMSIKHKKMSKWVPIVLAAAAVDIFFIVLLGLTALCEIVILVVVQIALFIVNFVQMEKVSFLESQGISRDPSTLLGMTGELLGMTGIENVLQTDDNIDTVIT